MGDQLHEQLRSERDKAREAAAQHQRRGNRLEAERDQAKAQALAEVREALKASAIWFIRNPGVDKFTLVEDRDEAKEWLDLDPEVIEVIRAGPREISALLSTLEDTQEEES